MPARSALVHQGPMCLACGVDLEDPRRCQACGHERLLITGQSVPYLGMLAQYRKSMRKRSAMRIADGPEGSTFLMHDGTVQTFTPDRAPKPIASSAVEATSQWWSPVAAILCHANALSFNRIELPWTVDVLYRYAFDYARRSAVDGRRLALDACALGRLDLLEMCGLSRDESTWLRLVDAARRGDPAGVVREAAALPADRYRHKIAVLAAFATRLVEVPDAGRWLAAALAAYATSEPLAGVLQRMLGIAERTAQQRIDDLAMLAKSLRAPQAVVNLATTALGMVDASSAKLLGGRGQLAVAHRDRALNAETATALMPSCDLDWAPLSIVDDLIDAGLVDAARVQRLRRPEQPYLLARTSPDLLTGQQVAEVGHSDEAIRRAHLAGDESPAERAPESPMGRHFRAVGVLLRNRPSDLNLADVLPAYRNGARSLAAALAAPDDPVAELDDTVLADRSTWLPLVALFGTDVLLNGLRQAAPGLVEWLSLVAAREHLFLADWARAVNAARRCLDGASDESIRDEAQNLLACALHNMGDDTSALRELESAIQGQYSVALLANIGVVASRLNPELAAQHLTRVVREAPTLAMKANAAMHALVMWQSDGTRIWEGEDLEARRLPVALREPLRSIVAQPIEAGQFRAIAKVLARFDSEWFRNPASLKGSPHKDTLAAAYYRAAAGEDTFLATVDVLATVTDWAKAPDWIRIERDDLIRQTRDFLAEHIDDPANMAGVVALAIVEKLRGISSADWVILALLGVATLTYHLSDQEEEIADHLIKIYAGACEHAATLGAEDREIADNLVEVTTRRITYNLCQARARELDQRVEPYNEALMVLDATVRGTPLWFSARRVVAEMVDACQRANEQLKPWLRMADREDIRSMLVDLFEHARDLEIKARRVLAMD